MRTPRLCLLCGRLRGDGEDDAAACAGCGEMPPEVTWQSTQSYAPGRRAGQAVVMTLLGIVVLAAAVVLAYAAVRGARTGGATLLMLFFSLIVAAAAGLVFWGAGYTLFVRTYRFNSADGRVTGDVSTLAGRVRTAFGLNYVLRPLALPASARDLTSARAFAADPAALCERLRAAGPTDEAQAWLGLDEDVVVVLAAIFGMAARGEIDVRAGTGRRFWIGPRPEHVKELEEVIWLRARGGGAPSLAFERRLHEHLDAIASTRRGDAIPGSELAAYRVGAAREEVPLVQLADVVAHFAIHAEGDVGEHLRELFAAEAVTVYQDEVAAALVAAAKVDPRATRALVLDVASTMDAVS